MDTKWKNTRYLSKLLPYLTSLWKQDWLWLLLGIGAYIFGFRLAGSLKDAIPKHMSLLALKINLSFALGGISLIKYILIRQKWNLGTTSMHFFQEWLCRKRNMYRLLFLYGTVFSALAAALFYVVKTESDRTKVYSVNYMLLKTSAVGYILIGTLAIQWAICQVTIAHELNKWLGSFMENAEKINQKNLEAAVRNEKMKVDLISNVSHDLKTPLTSMVGYIELLKKEKLDDVMSDYVEVISNRAQKLKQMIDSLFDLAKTSSGNVKLKFESMEMNRLIEQVLADMAEQVTQSRRELVVTLAQEPTAFTADSIHMYRIVQNLIENALKYSQESTRIFLKSSAVNWQSQPGSQENGQKVRFEITNTSNYPMDFTKEQILERFARGDESRTTEGNGLGLAIVNTYTAALGGSFDITIDCDQFKAAVEFQATPDPTRPKSP